MAFINAEGHAASTAAGGPARCVPACLPRASYKDGDPLRNGTVTTIAPTGTLSMIGGCSSGVEPVFAYVYIRNIMDGTEMLEVNPVLREKLQERGLYSDALMRKIAKEGTIAHIDGDSRGHPPCVCLCPRRKPGSIIPGCRPLSSGTRTTRCPRP